MPSAAQVLANRQNSLHSTGPVTATGKAAASANSLRHGLTAKHVVIRGEDPAEYESQRQAFIRDLRPANAVEAELVDELAANTWRLARAHRIETAIFSQLAGDSPDPDTALAMAFLERPKEIDRILRYMTSIERAYWRAFNKLEAMQKARIAQAEKLALEQAYIQAAMERQAKPAGQSASFRKPADTAAEPALKTSVASMPLPVEPCEQAAGR